MALRTAFRQAREGILVPYRASENGNRGFVDLRGRPDLAATIAEAAASKALGALLVGLAQPNAAVVSLGCDLGVHIAAAAPPGRRHVAGGYLHVIADLSNRYDAQTYHALARALEAAAAAAVGNRNWELAFILQDVELRLDAADPKRSPSLTICIYASAPNQAAAARSREALIGVLDAAFASMDIGALFGGARGVGRND